MQQLPELGLARVSISLARVLLASLCLLVARNAVAQSGVLVSDTFTGPDGTALSSHTPNTAPAGAGWTSFSGTTARLSGNRAGVSGPSGTYQIWSVNSGAADVIVAGDVTSTASSPIGGLMLRGVDANNYWTVVLQDSRVVLYKVVAGNYTHRGQFIPPVVSGQTYHLEVRATGSQYDVYVNGTFRFTTTDSFQSTATRHGLLWYNSDSTLTVDNFEVRAASSPTISTLAPTSGAIGTSVTITGTNFGPTQGTSTVQFNGTTATAVSSWSTTSITATVPNGASSGPVIVTVNGQASNGVTFTLSAPGVLVSDTFTGSDGTALSSHTLDTAPAGAGWTSFSGATARLSGNRAGVSGPSGTYQIWSVNSGVADVIVAGDVTSTAGSPMGGLMLRGVDANNYWTVVLQDSRVVLYKVEAGNYTHRGQFIPPVVSGQTYRLEVRATGSQYNVYVNGTFRFTTTDPFQNTATRNGLLWHSSDSTLTVDNFEVRTEGSAPVISGLTPPAGPVGSSVTISGTNFGATPGTSTVRFNGTTATSVSNWSNTSITATVPSGATSGPVTVTVSGQASNGVTFAVGVPPGISAVTPTTAPIAATVIVTGTNFGASQGGSIIRFNTTVAQPTAWNNTTITVPVPSGATSGPVTVTVNGLASNGVAFTVAPDPYITLLSTTSGTIGAPVTISGASFGATQGSSTVTFNGTSAGAASAWSATSISVNVPAGATTGDIRVTVGGLASNGVPFTVVTGPPPPSCSYDVLPSNLTVGYPSAQVTFFITASENNCEWQAQSSSGFVSVNGSATGEGDGSVVYHVANNPGTEGRAAQLTIAGRTVSVTQRGTGSMSLRVPYFGYYFILDEVAGGGVLNHIDEVSGFSNFAQLQYKRTYSPSEGQQLANANISIFVELGISEERMNNPALLGAYLDDVQAGLVNANMWNLVAAVAPGEEWYSQVFNPDGIGGWATFSGITAATHGDCSTGPQACWIVARRNLVRDKLTSVIATIKSKWGKPVMLVENSWSDTYDLFGAGPAFYVPIPSNLDILGMDPYIDSTGYSSDCGSGMQQKFYNQVGRFYDHVLANYTQPIMMVGQAFSSGGWVMPSTCQMQWWYELAQSSTRFAGTVWFTYGTPAPEVVSGVRSYLEQLTWLRSMYLYNQSLP